MHFDIVPDPASPTGITKMRGGKVHNNPSPQSATRSNRRRSMNWKPGNQKRR